MNRTKFVKGIITLVPFVLLGYFLDIFGTSDIKNLISVIGILWVFGFFDEE